jgi:Transcriptional accessory protein
MQQILSRLAAELSYPLAQVERTVALLDDGNTIPFITRYRKEVTGGLDEEQLRTLADRLSYLRNLEARRSEVLAALEAGGHLTPELAEALAAAQTLQAIEDIYLPFRPKRRTRAQIAREQGLQELADFLLAQEDDGRSPEELATPFIDPEKGLASVDDVLAGARDIVAETIAETAQIRQAVREATRRTGIIGTGKAKEDADPEGKYAMYYEYNEPLSSLPPHRILAINRGEREGALKVDLNANHDAFIATLQRRYAKAAGWLGEELRSAVADGYKRLLAPAIERDLRQELTERAEEHALMIFSANLRGLLLQPPLRGRIVMGIDPGYRTGCKVAIVDATGKYLQGGVIYLHEPERAKSELLRHIRQWGVQIIAIGNGTASRETEALVAEVIREVSTERRYANLRYTIVSEAGASVYSASTAAREEFPDLDATQRGNISIARRLQDPLAELVKIDPKALGVGLYQHDVDQKRLGSTLEAVVESAVNYVGVDLNTASAELLTYVAGLNSRVAKAIVAYRDANGPFRSRKELLKVKGLGPKAFEQAAGFLRIPDADDPLDATAIHPESYPAARKLIEQFSADRKAKLPEVANEVQATIQGGATSFEELARELELGEPTLRDILDAMAKPGRDPREDLPPPLLREDVLSLEDLQPGMWLKGTVRNVVDFGAFVDIGVKQDGLVHVSELSERRVKHPLDLVQVGDIVEVRVLSVDSARGRIALSMRKA